MHVDLQHIMIVTAARLKAKEANISPLLSIAWYATALSVAN
jgi:hypothetical protein